jgi:GST-like protein
MAAQMITLYTSATPNGFRASIMLEESGLPYRVHAVDMAGGEHKSPDFLAVNATGRIPAIVDDHEGQARPLALAETLAIALYLSEKSGRLSPSDANERAVAYQWAATVISGFGAATPGIFFARQLDAAAHVKMIAKFYADIDNYLGAMNTHLGANAYLAGDTYSFADVLALPTVAVSLKNFEVDLTPFPAVERWRDRVLTRPAVARGLKIPG